MDNQKKADSNSMSFVTTSSLWPPRLISELSAWNQHVPFAGWVIEATRPRVFVELGTHAGVSYFAFCESVARHDLGTQCHAVDTWVGDEHAGFYEDDIYLAVQRTNSDYYESFSRLMRTTFDDAAEEFPDGSIDLLHLDGLHTYEAVRHDFETWLPKLSDRAVMLFHDTNERKADFGVHRFLAELRLQYPTFEFTHGHGLGVVCIGKNTPQPIADLVALEEDPSRVAEIRTVYEALGRRLSAELQTKLLTRTVAKRDAKLADYAAAVAKRDSRLEEYKTTVATRDARLDDYRATIAKRDARVGALEATVAKRDGQVAALDATVGKRDDQLASLDKAITLHKTQIAARDRQLTDRSATVAKRDTQIAGLNATVKRRDAQLVQARSKQAALRRSLTRLSGRRSVRIALAVSKPFKPIFRSIRRARKALRRTPSSAPADQTLAATDRKPATKADAAVLQLPSLLPEVDSAAGSVTVIVPVHNAPDDLIVCLEAVVRTTTGDTQLLIIDDASTDIRIGPILDNYARLKNVRVLRNDQNLGFVRTVNRGFAETTGDVVILNSDVEVTPRWLDRLRIAARTVPDAGTVTPLSDNAGAFSAPEIGKKNYIPESITRDEIGRLVAQGSGRAYPEGPTGNGFCMYIRRACIDDVGPFDAEAFPRGYGEENDFCMRGLAKGWKHIVDDSTYVFHTRSASFGEEKAALATAGREVLEQRYPQYGALVREFVSSPKLLDAQSRITEVFDAARTRSIRALPRVLFVLHSATGGTPATTQDLVHGLGGIYEAFILVSNGKVVTLSRFENGNKVEIGRWPLSQEISVIDLTNGDYRRIIQAVLVDNAIDIVHVRHLIGHTFELPAVAQSLGIPVVLSFHDFYYVCPTVHLVDDQERFCGGVCTAGQGTCPTPTPWLAGLPHLKHSWVYDWRSRSQEMFNHVDAFITASESAKAFYLQAFPDLEARVFEVIEHGRDLEVPAEPVGIVPDPSERIRILLPGNIGPHKGARFVRDLIAIDEAKRLEFHLLGRASGELKNIVTHHGTYDRGDFEERARAVRPSFAGIFSTTAESFSHTLTEAWAAGIPVLASKLGALEERVDRHGGGWLLDIEDPQSAYATILAAAADSEAYRVQQKLAVQAARDSRSIEDMALSYASAYTRAKERRRTFAPSRIEDLVSNRPLRIGVFLPKAETGQVKPPGNIRVLLRLQDPALGERVSWEEMEVDAFLEDNEQQYDIDVAIVQRTAVPSAAVDAFVAKCTATNTGIVFDIDDDLLSNDPTWKELEDYEPFVHSLETLLAAAEIATVSTPTLATQLAAQSPARIAVVENALDPSLWFQPLPWGAKTRGSESVIRETTGVKALFAGGMTHAEDLEILRSAIDMAKERSGVEFDLYVVGGAPQPERQEWYTSVEIPSGHGYYPRFVHWLRAMADYFDIGVAPLVDNDVNRSKSDLRFLEYAALKLPGIYSKGPAFSTVVDGRTGITVANTVEAWSDSLVRLWEDKQLRANIVDNAFDYVATKRTIGNQRGIYLAHLRNAAFSEQRLSVKTST